VTAPDKSYEAAVASLVAYQDRLDQAARAGRAAYERAFETPPTGLGAHEIDLDKTILRVNKGELRILGYREADVVGHVASDFVVMPDVSQRAMDKKLSGVQQLKPFVRAFKRVDGSAVTMLLLDRYILDAGGKVVGIRTVLTPLETAPSEHA
jgi:PAS domain S-box-containing protein